MIRRVVYERERAVYTSDRKIESDEKKNSNIAKTTSFDNKI